MSISMPGAPMSGSILEVSERRSGSNLAADHIIGATSLLVNDPSPFDDAGGSVIIGTTTYTYTSIDYTAIALVLFTPLPVAVEEGTPIWVYPPSLDKWAMVQIDVNDDALYARVPHYLAAELDVGMREEVDRESVLIAIQHGVWTIQNLIALEPIINGAYVALGSLPPEASTDGVPPNSSPTPIPTGGVGSIFLLWPAVLNHDPVTYDVFGSATAGFTPGPTNLLGSTAATSFSVRTLADGTALVNDTPYYFAIQARDIDGAAPVSSLSAAAQMTKITNDFVAANYVYAGEVFANQIRSGLMTADITISGSFATASSGQRSIMDALGIRQYGPDGVSIITDLPNDPGQTARFAGIVNATGLTVNDGLELRGQNNMFAMSSLTTLATTTAGSSTAPSMSVDWDKYNGDIWHYGYSTMGFHHESDGSSRYSVHNTFDYGLIKSPSGLYVFPEVTSATGNKRSTWGPVSSAIINIGTAVRMITYGSKCMTNGATETFHFRSHDVSTLVAGGTVAPVQKVEIAAPNVNNYVIQNEIGRCFSPIGSFALENNFAHAEYNQYVSPKTITFRRYAVTDSAITLQGSALVVNSPFIAGEGIAGVVYGSSARLGMPGTDQNIWLVFGNQNAYAFSTAGVRLTAFDFPLPSGVGVIDTVGSTAAGSNEFLGFRSAVTNNNNTAILINKHTAIHWLAADSSVWWTGYTWFDSDAAGTGQHETNVSTLSSITMKKRARLTITVPPLPDPLTGQGTPRGTDDVNSFRVYMQRQATIPARTSLWKQTIQPADLATTVTYDAMPQWSATTNPPASTNFPAQASAVIQSSSIGADGLPKFKLSGDGSSHYEALDVSGAGSAALSGKAFDQLYYSIRAQSRIVGGGTISVDASYNIKWSQRFILIGLGRDANLATNGYFNITTPTVGTIIPGYGGAPSATVTSAGIPLASWTALWYVVPYGSNEVSLDANFRVTTYTSNLKVPNDWILIAVRNTDATRVEWATGDKVEPGSDSGADVWTAVTFQNGWTNYAGGYDTTAFRRLSNGMVLIKGMVKHATTTTTGTVFTLPVGYRPAATKIFNGKSSTGMARIDILSDGQVSINSYSNATGFVGNASFVGLENIQFLPV